MGRFARAYSRASTGFVNPEQQEALAQEEGQGLLFRLANTLSIPGDFARGVIFGQPGKRLTPQEVLKTRFGVEDPGFVSSLLLDVATDPLTLVGGIGALTKAGRGAKRLQSLLGQHRQTLGPSPLIRETAEKTARRKELIKEISQNLKRRRSPLKLGKTARERVRLGQQRALTLGIPFTNIERSIPIPGEAGVLGAIGATLSKIPGRQTFSQAARLGEAKPLFDLATQRISQGQTRALKLSEQLNEAREAAIRARQAQRPGLSFDAAQTDLFREISQGREALDAIRSTDEAVAASAKERLRRLSGEERDLVTKLRDITDAAHAEQVAAGVRFADALPDYAERMITPAGRNFITDNNLWSDFTNRINNLNVREGSQIRRSERFRNMLTTEVNDFFREKGFQGDFFNLNFAQTIPETVRLRDLSVIKADLANALIKEFKNVPGKAGNVPLVKFIQSTGLKRVGGLEVPSAGRLKALEKEARRAGTPQATLPLEVVEAFNNDVGKFFDKAPEEIQKLVGTYDAITSGYRLLLTQGFPGFHFRNFTSNLILNFLGGVDNPRFYIQAAKQVIQSDPGIAARFGVKFDSKLRDQLLGLGVLQGGQLRTLGREVTDAGRRAGRGGRAIARGVDRLRGSTAGKIAFTIGQMTEDIGRVAHYLSKKAKGLTDQEAVDSVNKFLFDYSNRALTPFERDINNRLFFFYRWTRFAVPLMVRALFESPRRSAIAIKATVQPSIERPGGLPLFAKETSAIPIGEDEQGDLQILAGLGSPFEEFQKFDFATKFDFLNPKSRDFVESSKAAAIDFANLLAPLIKIPLQLGTGQDFFLQRPIEEANRSPLSLEIPGVVEKIDDPRRARSDFVTDPLLRFAVANSPVSRFVSTANQFIDPAKPTSTAIARTLTGARIFSFDEELERNRAAQRVLRKKILEDPSKARTGEFTFLTQRGKLDPELQGEQAILKRLERQGRDLRKLRNQTLRQRAQPQEFR